MLENFTYFISFFLMKILAGFGGKVLSKFLMKFTKIKGMREHHVNITTYNYLQKTSIFTLK